MWNRADVKTKGKESFKRNYWNSVLVAFIYGLFFAATTGGVSSRREEITNSINEQGYSDAELLAIALIVLGIVGTVIAISTLVDIFLLNPLEVGCERFFLVNQSQNAQVGELGHAFKNNYMNAVLGLFLKNFLTGLATCLFVIPGIILGYSYRLVPYILAEDPGISGVDALKKSRAMMSGNKWSTFVYDLSFIGWAILSCCTCGILGLFYVSPYKKNADAALYQAIKG